MAAELIDGHALLDFAADWKNGAALSLRWQTEIAAALDGGEDRAGLRPAPRATASWRLTARDAMEAARLETQLRAALDSGLAAAPCHARPCYVMEVANDGQTLVLKPTRWPWAVGDWLLVFDASGQTQTRQITAVEDNGTALQLNASIADPPPVGAAVYPLIFGRLEIEMNGNAVDCRLHAAEWRLGAAAEALTPFCGAAIAPDALLSAEARESIGSAVEGSSADAAGFGVEPTNPSLGGSRHGVELNALIVSEEELADIEAFFAALGGRRLPFWLPAREPAMTITAAGDSAAEFIVQAQGLAESWEEEPDAFLWFEHPTLAPMAGRIAAIVAGVEADTERVTLDAPPAVAPDPDWTVRRLRLLRLDSDELREICRADGRIDVRLHAVELPKEYSGEVAAASPQPAYLYRFQRRLDESAVWRLTSHAESVTHDCETYLPAAISHRVTQEGAKESIVLESFAAEGNPLAIFAPRPPEDRVDLRLTRLDLAATDPEASAQTVFCGFVGRMKFTGRKIEARVGSPMDSLDCPLPGFRVGAPCNHALYGAGCGLNPADWATAGVIDSMDGAQVSLSVDPGKSLNWFAGGHLTTGSGADAEWRTILSSDGVVLMLNRPLLAAQPGDALTAHAGCSHLPEDCRDKFDNFVNYGGHPLLPEVDPSLGI
jgi:uncharacterized phage protein (TIGR02218 family)